MPDDIGSAARRLAHHARTAPPYGDGGSLLDADLALFLPVLDAVAAGQADAGRVERWARFMFDVRLLHFDEQAGVAMGLADAEAAARVARGWAAYEKARDALVEFAKMDPHDGYSTEVELQEALDAAVRRLAGVEGTP